MLIVPSRLSKRIFKSAQRNYEREKQYLIPKLDEVAVAAKDAAVSREKTMEDLEEMITRMKAYVQKLESLRERKVLLYEQSEMRISHVQKLYEIDISTATGYEEWSNMRLIRYIIEYLCRTGFRDTAARLADIKGVTDFVDFGYYENCARIADAVGRGELDDLVRWCRENRKALMTQRCSVDIESEVRFQEYIELTRQHQFQDAREHARKYLPKFMNMQRQRFCEAASLMIVGPETTEKAFAVRSSLLFVYV